jgi:predicted RNA-binding protein
MCQATVFLDGVEIMSDVLLVETTQEGIRLVALFEPVKLIPAIIRKIDLGKHLVILETIEEDKEDHERTREITNLNSSLD